jgi:hypothetical protein
VKFSHAPTIDVSGAERDRRRTLADLPQRQHPDQRVTLFEAEAYRISLSQARKRDRASRRQSTSR